jgi:UDP-2-acetamido-3-amino-2,3-dideoxy-glucuronate N-acetyltransferase
VATIRSVRRIRFTQDRGGGVLTEFSVAPDGIPFPLRRVFTIGGVPAGGVRGDHAHRGCTQMLACLSGSITVDIRDGSDRLTESLVDDGTALVIPPMLWNSEVFEEAGTVLAVFCDEPYEPSDYIRDWDEFRRLARERR